MVTLDAAQRENLSTALVVARAWAVASGVDPQAASERVAFVWWTESRGYIYANDGSNQSDSPGFDKHPEWPAILRRSLNIRYDKVGNNGRSTGGLQQISADVGGGWGDMAGTMDPAISTARFLAKLVITNNPMYEGWLLKTDGTLEKVTRLLDSPTAADVLRIQQPLVNEALSSNYDGSQVAIAREIVAQLSPSTGDGDVLDWITMADQATLDTQWDRIRDRIVNYKVNGVQSLADYLINFRSYIATAVAGFPIPSKANGKTYPLSDYIASIDLRTLLADEVRQLRVVRDTDPTYQGACYLVGPNIFRWLSGAELAAWQQTGLVSSSVKDLDHKAIVELSAGVSARSAQNGVLWSADLPVIPAVARRRP